MAVDPIFEIRLADAPLVADPKALWAGAFCPEGVELGAADAKKVADFRDGG